MSTIQIQSGRGHKSILVGPKITGILHLLEISKVPVRYRGFHAKSKIAFKKSFINHLKYCVEKELIINTKIGGTSKQANQSWFVISEKGRSFMEMLS